MSESMKHLLPAKKPPFASPELQTLRWILAVNVLVMLLTATMIGLLGAMVVPINQVSTSANQLLSDIQNSNIIDVTALLMQDFSQSQYPSIQKAISLGAQALSDLADSLLSLFSLRESQETLSYRALHRCAVHEFRSH